jgi:hypothetical protein
MLVGMKSRCIGLLGVLGFAHVIMVGQQQSDNQISQSHKGTVFISAQPAGVYLEKTVITPGGVESTLENTIIFNRLGSRVEYKVYGVYRQDLSGKLLSAHCVQSSSQSSVQTDVDISGNALQSRIKTGDKEYSQTTPFTGKLIGPEGSRRIMNALAPSTPQSSYQTFLCETGAVGTVTVKYIGNEALTGADGSTVAAIHVDQKLEGFPDLTALWLDASGAMLKMHQNTPFGPMETKRDDNSDSPSVAVGAELPNESYQGTMALSNIRVPNPRQVEEMDLELTQHNSSLGWPDFNDKNQTVISETPQHVVLRIRKDSPAGANETAPLRSDLADYVIPNPLLQSDDDRIIAVADQVTKGTTGPWDAALALQKWTAEHMTFDTGIAVAPASEIISNRRGTCVGYSILLASLLRAAHLPSRIKMGYVYDGGVWGGHAWAEVNIGGTWVGLDSAEYFPGSADAARFSAVTMTGKSGNLEGLGDLARLYGNLDVRVLAYTLYGKRHVVSPNAQGFALKGNRYSNPWIGLSVSKPSFMSYTHLDEHWPETTILQMEGRGQIITLHYSEGDASQSLQTQAKEFFDSHGLKGEYHAVRWGRMRALQSSTDGLSGIIAESNGSLWAVTLKGELSEQQLRTALGRITIQDLGEGETSIR